jgi:hypothetical protein
VNYQRDTGRPRSEVSRRSGITTETDNDINAAAGNQGSYFPDCAKESPWKAEGGQRYATGKRQAVDGNELVSSFRHESRLETFRSPEHDDGCFGFTSAECIGRSQQGIDVSRGSSPRQHNHGHPKRSS